MNILQNCRIFVIIVIYTFCTTTQSDNKVILITGASRGIGWHTAKILAAKGHQVFAGMRDPEAFSQKNKLIPSNIYILPLDTTSESSITQAIQTVYNQTNRIDILINNAGIAVFGPLELIELEQAKKVFDVNFFGTMRLMQAVLPIMREQRNGLIINMSSTSGVRPSPGWDIYGASKFALEGMSEAVAAQVKQWNIKVVLVEPGTTSTDFMQQSTQQGSRTPTNAYDYSTFMHNALTWMQERLLHGQEPDEVADVIAAIINNPNPALRYQTSTKGTATVAARFCDPTGQTSVQEQEALVNQLSQGSLDHQIGNSFR